MKIRNKYTFRFLEFNDEGLPFLKWKFFLPLGGISKIIIYRNENEINWSIKKKEINPFLYKIPCDISRNYHLTLADWLLTKVRFCKQNRLLTRFRQHFNNRVRKWNIITLIKTNWKYDVAVSKIIIEFRTKFGDNWPSREKRISNNILDFFVHNKAEFYPNTLPPIPYPISIFFKDLRIYIPNIYIYTLRDNGIYFFHFIVQFRKVEEFTTLWTCLP